MAQTLWGETKTRRRRRRRQPEPAASYSITGTGNDCEIIGHTEGYRDLAGCTTCIDCGVKIFCPRCIEAHPTDAKAISIVCEMHESQVNHAV